MLNWGEEHFERGRQKGRLEGQAEGQAKGRAEGVLRLLSARGIYVDDESRKHILSCLDLATLDRWFDQALKATSLEDVLGHRAQ